MVCHINPVNYWVIKKLNKSCEKTWDINYEDFFYEFLPGDYDLTKIINSRERITKIKLIIFNLGKRVTRRPYYWKC